MHRGDRPLDKAYAWLSKQSNKSKIYKILLIKIYLIIAYFEQKVK